MKKVSKNQEALTKYINRGTLVVGELYTDFGMFELRNGKMVIVKGTPEMYDYFMGNLNYAVNEGDSDLEEY